MESNFLCFELHGKRGDAYIKPGEITSISPSPDGGSRIVTRQKQLYYVVEAVIDVEASIRLFFKNLKGQ